MGLWSVVLELDGEAPKLIRQFAKLEDAQQCGFEMAKLHQFTGGKVTISQKDSADQLQPYGAHQEKFHRQEPEKAAVGQDVTVHVPRIVIPRRDHG